MKGIVLAGGTGSRLWPITKVTSKQLLPVYDKPMIYYPISTLMLAGVREILIITAPQDQKLFSELLGDGTQFGVNFKFEIQPKPEGLAQALIIGEEFLNRDSCLMILGDNLFHGAGLGRQLKTNLRPSGAHIFTYQVANPQDYGVLTLDQSGNPFSIEEKPKNPKTRMAVTGLYYFDSRASNIAKSLRKSERGELEITSLIDWYLQNGELNFTNLGRGIAWLDTGTPQSLIDAGNYVSVIENRTGSKVACLEEIAFQNGWIGIEDLRKSAEKYQMNSYGKYIAQLAIQDE
jgi:glucose-1-phosphate thymidylyltransferase